ncbi:helix-turn-helix domain-containing protein [Methylobacterium ajmalii]|jgi:uncharacterized membrane protein|uniref:helix-turn-helix domain-containing protein n=1 Tax=Methylobacterium ajmalii TaxID=2738439 RepID=UPI00190A0EA2|nr:helix-turn-helix domain-containing protein [Methylobacterium ajmalii]MBK3398927.1 helix-turn-helix domain-containing protein [Methylobacterium ajmalii]MBK3409584.1 helix-turn-helix domain-containing protein [Methylobacterium ajmalii]MBK3425691.1 helix-turn-helix domain-containing protein [Methylobacterium ajmalii]
MTSGLDTFAKVRALHDRASTPGEKAAAASRMEALARSAGMTVAEAVSKLDAPKPKTRAEAMADAFNAIFNSPEALAERAERDRQRLKKAADLVAEYGSEQAIFADTEIEAACRAACEPLLGPGEAWNTLYRLDGWDGYGRRSMPASVRAAVSQAWPLPSTVAAAWAEYQAFDKLITDRYVVDYYFNPHAYSSARQYVVEERINNLPAADLCDIKARVAWLDYWAHSEIEQDVDDAKLALASLRSDIERLSVQFGQAQPAPEGASDDLDTPKPQAVQTGQRPTTRAERRAAAAALISEGLTDREVARRLGISPTTVGAIRRAQQGAT